MIFFNKKVISLTFLILTAALLTGCSGGGGGGADANATYTLAINVVNGTVSVLPQQASYPSGTRVTLTATAASGYDFDRWEGGASGRENPLVVTMDGNKSITAVFTIFNTLTYYVDYDNGSDTNSGLSASSAWKHAPGDSLATGLAKTAQLGPGVTVLLKGGVIYRGNITVPADGSTNHPVVYRGDAWPGLAGVKAIIDGGDPITGWTKCASATECLGNPNYAQIYYAYLPGSVDPLSVNLHEYNTGATDDEFLWPAQTPNPTNPYFYDDRSDFIDLPQSNLTRTSIADPAIFNQSDPTYWNDSYILVWVNPNIVVTRKITGFVPAEKKVTFDDLGANAIYPNGQNQNYAIFNSPHAINRAGEYFITTTPDAQSRLKILLWPRSATTLDQRITRSVRSFGVDINTHSNISIEGFIVRKHSGIGLRDGVAVGTISAAHLPTYNLVVKNNLITHNRKGGSDSGYGGVYLSNSHNSVVEGNTIIDNPRHAGLFFSGGSGIIARNNTITRSGSTSLRLYTIENGIVEGNVIRESNGSHANGITMYLGSKNILVAGNRLYDCASPVTFQDSGNLYFINNLIDATDRESNVNEWGDTSGGPWARGTIAFFNNTFVRNNRNASLNIGDNPTLNTYIVINNFIDGGASEASIVRSNNVYTGLMWNQGASYGWALKTGEFVEENLSTLFFDAPGLDYRLKATSPARGAGIDITPYFPAQLFPTYDLRKDITGKTRTAWDVGAYAY